MANATVQALRPEKGSKKESRREPRREPHRFALVQEDALRAYLAGRSESKVRVVGAVFTGYLHVFVRSPLHIRRPEDFTRLQIWRGQEGSLTRHAADRFFDSLGIPSRSLAPEPVWGKKAECETVATLEDGFRKGDVDVALVLATPGADPLKKGMEAGTHSLYSLDYETLRSLTLQQQRAGSRSQTTIGHIPAETYKGQKDRVPAILHRVLLVSREGAEPEVAERVLDKARRSWNDQARKMEPRCHDLKTAAHMQVPDDLGPWMLEGIDTQSSPWRAAGLTLLAVLVGIGLFVLTARLVPRRLWPEDRLPLGLALGLALSILLITVATWVIEKDLNENFSSFQESFWSITVYLFSGLEDRVPYTPVGRAVAALGLLLGPAFFAVMSGWLARFFIRREKRMPQNLRNHYLLVNWNPRAAAVVREIHHPLLLRAHGTSVIVLLTDREDLSLRQLKEAGSGTDEAFEDFYLSIGDPTTERGLLNANAQDAKAIVIFADEEHGDERAMRSLMALRKIARERGITNLQVVVELLDPANGSILDEISRDFPGLLERVSNAEVRTQLLAQAAMNAGIVQFYTDLLRVSEDTNEIYTLPVPETAAGMGFRDYTALLAGVGEPLIAVGIQREVDGRARMYSNPRPGEPESVLQPGDRLVLIAYSPPDPDALPVPSTSLKESAAA